VHAEHVAIFEAAIGGKADEAVQLLVQHCMCMAKPQGLLKPVASAVSSIDLC
jgi:DNA-binding GntR family transcriptional regulator